MEEATQSELKKDSNEVQNYFQTQNVKIKEEVVSDDEPTDLQPIAQVYLQEYQVKSEVVDSTALAVVQLEDKHEDTKTYYSCSLCNKKMIGLIHLRTHLRNYHHLSMKEILEYLSVLKCKYCHQQFSKPHILMQHEDSHTLPYKCDICDKRFSIKSILKRHKLIHSEPQFPCPHCHKKFRQKNQLKDHIESLHSGVAVVHKCDQCKKKFKRKRYLMEHIKFKHNKTNQYSFKCDKCGKCFRYKQNIKRHFIEVHHTMSKSYRCSYCSVKFKSMRLLKQHIKSMKHISVVPVESNKSSRKPRNRHKICNVPNAEGVSEPVGHLSELQNQHIKEEILEGDGPEIKPISEVCLPEFQEGNIKTEVNSVLEFADEVETANEITSEIIIDEVDLSTLEGSTEQALSDGLSVSSKNETSADKQVQVMQAEDKHEVKTPRFSCSLCKKDFLCLRNLKVHLNQIHHLSGEKMLKYYPVFECKFCHSRFETPYKLDCHEITHTLPFKCDICNERFGQKSRLTTHKLRHTETKFTCPHCDMKFRFETHFIKHVESQHNVLYNKCDQCEKRFKNKWYLMQHIRKIHEGLTGHIIKRSWECDKCNKCFRLKTYLKSHQREVHESVPANNCGVKFNVIQDLKQHIETQHGETNKKSTDSNNCIVPKFIITNSATPAVGPSLIKIQHFNPDIKIKEEILDGSEIQPISEVFLPEYQEEHIKTEVNSPLDSTLNDEVETTTENDVEIKTAIDEMDDIQL